MNYSVLIVTRNSEKVYNLLTDFWQYQDPNCYSIHIIDNNSDADFVAELSEVVTQTDMMTLSNVKTHFLNKNYLYGRANNYGIKYVMEN